jgi:hypothetical protein
MMMLLYPLEGEIEGYSRDQFLNDCIDEAEKEVPTSCRWSTCSS